MRNEALEKDDNLPRQFPVDLHVRYTPCDCHRLKGTIYASKSVSDQCHGSPEPSVVGTASKQNRKNKDVQKICGTTIKANLVRDQVPRMPTD